MPIVKSWRWLLAAVVLPLVLAACTSTACWPGTGTGTTGTVAGSGSAAPPRASARAGVYPAAVPTLGNELSAAGRCWAAYLQDMGNDPARDHTVATARGLAMAGNGGRYVRRDGGRSSDGRGSIGS